MSNEFIKESSHAALEQEIQELAIEVREKVGFEKKDARAAYGAIRESLKSKSESYHSDSSSVLPNYMVDDSPEIKLKVEKLVDGVFHVGIMKTLKIAKKEGPFFVDALHDVLSEKLYEEMKRRRLI